MHSPGSDQTFLTATPCHGSLQRHQHKRHTNHHPNSTWQHARLSSTQQRHARTLTAAPCSSTCSGQASHSASSTHNLQSAHCSHTSVQWDMHPHSKAHTALWRHHHAAVPCSCTSQWQQQASCKPHEAAPCSGSSALCSGTLQLCNRDPTHTRAIQFSLNYSSGGLVFGPTYGLHALSRNPLSHIMEPKSKFEHQNQIITDPKGVLWVFWDESWSKPQLWHPWRI